MGREKREDRDRGSPKVRLDSGKIVFNSGDREARGRQELKKVSKVGRETRLKWREK
jgi:hypothetical protein